jgi:hypothetical protein
VEAPLIEDIGSLMLGAGCGIIAAVVLLCLMELARTGDASNWLSRLFLDLVHMFTAGLHLFYGHHRFQHQFSDRFFRWCTEPPTKVSTESAIREILADLDRMEENSSTSDRSKTNDLPLEWKSFAPKHRDSSTYPPSSARPRARPFPPRQTENVNGDLLSRNEPRQLAIDPARGVQAGHIFRGAPGGRIGVRRPVRVRSLVQESAERLAVSSWEANTNRANQILNELFRAAYPWGESCENLQRIPH